MLFILSIYNLRQGVAFTPGEERKPSRLSAGRGKRLANMSKEPLKAQVRTLHVSLSWNDTHVITNTQCEEYGIR